MPFLEQEHFANELLRNPSLNPATMSPNARHRLAILTCPSAYDGESTIQTVPVAHYAAQVGSTSESWIVFDVPYGLRTPWILSPELPQPWNEVGPHNGGFNVSGSTTGTVHFHRNN